MHQKFVTRHFRVDKKEESAISAIVYIFSHIKCIYCGQLSIYCPH